MLWRFLILIFIFVFCLFFVFINPLFLFSIRDSFFDHNSKNPIIPKVFWLALLIFTRCRPSKRAWSICAQKGDAVRAIRQSLLQICNCRAWPAYVRWDPYERHLCGQLVNPAEHFLLQMFTVFEFPVISLSSQTPPFSGKKRCVLHNLSKDPFCRRKVAPWHPFEIYFLNPFIHLSLICLLIHHTCVHFILW